MERPPIEKFLRDVRETRTRVPENQVFKDMEQVLLWAEELEQKHIQALEVLGAARRYYEEVAESDSMRDEDDNEPNHQVHDAEVALVKAFAEYDTEMKTG